MNFCSACGAEVNLAIPEGDDRARHICGTCGVIHYQNPKIVAGCVPLWDERVLLCRRAIEPRHGLWTLPAGYMENGETTAEAALRETLEEAQARVEIDALFTLLNVPRINQVYVMFRGRLLDLDFAPGFESLEVELFHEAEIPWDELAFPSIEKTLRLYFDDRRRGQFGIHTADIQRRPSEGR